MWNPVSEEETQRLDAYRVTLGISIPHVVIDLALLIVPIWFVWRLYLDWVQKVMLSIVFALGGLYILAYALLKSTNDS